MYDSCNYKKKIKTVLIKIKNLLARSKMNQNCRYNFTVSAVLFDLTLQFARAECRTLSRKTCAVNNWRMLKITQILKVPKLGQRKDATLLSRKYHEVDTITRCYTSYGKNFFGK